MIRPGLQRLATRPVVTLTMLAALLCLPGLQWGDARLGGLQLLDTRQWHTPEQAAPCSGRSINSTRAQGPSISGPRCGSTCSSRLRTACSFAFLLLRVFQDGRQFYRLPVAAAATEVFENISIALLRATHDGTPSPWARVAAASTLLKSGLILAMLSAAVRGVIRWLWVLRGPPHTAPTASESLYFNPAMPSPNAASLRARLRRSATRWASILFYAIFGTIAFELVLPVPWLLSTSLRLPYSSEFTVILVLLATFSLFYLLTEPIRIRSPQWSRIAWYPPLWVSICLAWALAAATERLYAPVRSQSIENNWQRTDIVLPIAAALLAAVFLRQLPWIKRSSVDVSSPPPPDPTRAQIKEWLSSGEYPIERHEQDLFQHRFVSTRIARMLLRDTRSVALLGTFGSGKSTVLNLLRAQLSEAQRTVVIADFDLWAVPRPADVPRLALDRIVSALDDYVDTIGLRDLPLSYQRLVAAVPSRWLSRVLGSFRESTDSLAELQRLPPVLEALTARGRSLFAELACSGSLAMSD